MEEKKILICIGGPTASGKTELAIKLAKYYQTEIISVDSRQIYKEMSIGTAKPTLEELNSVPHHFINHVSIHEPYNIGIFEKEVISLLEEKFKKHHILIAVGGSGLYFKVIFEGIDEYPNIDESITQKLQVEYQMHGLEFLQKTLAEIDPEYFNKVDIYNPVRLFRAISVYRQTGTPFSTFRKSIKITRKFESKCYYLDPPRELLYEKINLRVDKMIENGLVGEVLELNPYKHLKALQTVGYSELFSYFSKEYDFKEAILKIKQHSRQYAKRQITWFKNANNWIKLDQENLYKF